MHDRRSVVELMRGFVRGPDRGLAAAGRIEDALMEAYPDEDEAAGELVIALASYRPEGGPYLYDEGEMVELLARSLPVFERRAGGDAGS